MPIEVRWFDEAHSIVYYVISGEWDWQDLQKKVSQATKMEESVDGRVDAIVDLSHTRHVPPNIISNLQQIASSQPENLHFTVFIVNTRFYTMLFQVMTRISTVMQTHYRLSKSIEEATQTICADRGHTAIT